MTRRIAIYLTSTDQSPLSKRFPDYAYMLETLLAPHLTDAQFQHFNVVENDFPADPTAFDGVVLTGSAAYVADNDPWIATLFDHIRMLDAAGTKLLGVCFGHQAIAAALGGRVAKREITLGAPAMRLDAKRAWMQPDMDALRLFAGNFEQVIEVPEGMTVLGGHPDCPIGLVEKDAHILSLQFHPEFSAEFMTGYIEKVSDVVSPEKTEAAQVQVNNGHDGDVFGKWAAHFLQGKV